MEIDPTEEVVPLVVEERPPSLLTRVFSSAPEALGGFALAFVFLYFLLAEGDAILNNAIALVPTIAGKREAVSLTRAAEPGRQPLSDVGLPRSTRRWGSASGSRCRSWACRTRCCGG